jgi:hypothetical protein
LGDKGEKMKPLLILLILFLLSGCVKEGTDVKVSGAKDDFEVKLLFEQDGLKVYRFWDGGYYHYFTSQGETISMRHYGKTLRSENIR